MYSFLKKNDITKAPEFCPHCKSWKRTTIIQQDRQNSSSPYGSSIETAEYHCKAKIQYIDNPDSSMNPSRKVLTYCLDWNNHINDWALSPTNPSEG